MRPYTCMILIFYSTPAMFFCDATMYIYDNSNALEPHLLNVRLGLCGLAATGHNTMSISRPKEDSNFAFWPSQTRHSAV